VFRFTLGQDVRVLEPVDSVARVACKLVVSFEVCVVFLAKSPVDLKGVYKLIEGLLVAVVLLVAFFLLVRVISLEHGMC
jgi:hypothetical protein